MFRDWETIRSDKTPGWDFSVNTSWDVGVKPDLERQWRKKTDHIHFHKLKYPRQKNLFLSQFKETPCVKRAVTPIKVVVYVGRNYTRQCSSSFKQKVESLCDFTSVLRAKTKAESTGQKL